MQVLKHVGFVVCGKESTFLQKCRSLLKHHFNERENSQEHASRKKVSIVFVSRIMQTHSALSLDYSAPSFAPYDAGCEFNPAGKHGRPAGVTTGIRPKRPLML